MKLSHATGEMLDLIEKAWYRNSKRMVDTFRPIETCAHIIQNTDSAWYKLEPYDAWLYVLDIVPGHMATLHALNLEGKKALDKDLIRAELLTIMRDFNLRRLNVAIPAPVNDIKGILGWLGFIHEGVAREASVFDGVFVDTDLFGLLRREIEHDAIADRQAPRPKRKRRRRRGRRKKKWVTTTTPTESPSSPREESPSSEPPPETGPTARVTQEPPSLPATSQDPASISEGDRHV